ncbi:MAG: PD40 domain-containing protein, partial [Candidatus Latescibacteria bacterium]|nr:PD40 domain-containing protein [Candidatus Latescibacterota bacterium]
MSIFSESVKKIVLLLGVVSLLLLLCGVKGSAQQFGQNKVNYRGFNWSHIQTEHFDIYFYTESLSTVDQAARILEDSYQQLKRDFQHELRHRVPVIIYASHNDFEQTNVILQPIGETVGGFTELFKNRVVVPFEGSYEKFRHVLHHELTHAVTFDMLYGGLLESIVGRRYMFQLPLWVAEGLAEYESLGWETEADMVIRDAAISGYLPSIQQTGGYLVYKAGQSFFYYIAQQYGPEKIGEFLSNLATTRDVDKSLRLSLGLGVEELNKKWHRDLRKQYWPEIGKRQEAEEFAKKLTNHKEEGSYLNAAPAFSPYADKIAFLSDRSDYKDIYLMSAIDGTILKRLVQGEKSGEFEEMHWLRGGITWSSDATRIAFVAKSGAQDVLYIQTVKGNKIIDRYRFDLDGLFSPDWSLDGKKIVFIGLANGATDIYSVELTTGKLLQLTDDPYDEAYPCWSPDGTRIAFSSDRGPNPTHPDSIPIFGDHNIYVLNLTEHKLTQITTSPFSDFSPTWSPDGRRLAFSSDRNGIYNIYVTDIADADSIRVVPVTNALTGCFQPDWSPDGRKIAFSAFQERGWDIFTLESPFPEFGTELEPTPFRLEKQRYLTTKTVSTEADTTEQKTPLPAQTA